VRAPAAGRERGSALALVPAGFLVLMLLASIAVDSASAYLAQQQLRDTLADASSDAVTAGLSNGAYYRHGAVTLDPGAAAQAVCQDVAAQSDADLHQVRLSMSLTADGVWLEGSATVDAVFGRLVPGFGVRTVRASAVAVVSSGPGGGPVPGRSAAGPPTGSFTALPCS
jgi:hypothetical protein